MKIFKLLFFIAFSFLSKDALACTPYGTPLVNYNIIGNDLNITVTSTSSWSCTYEYELELICAQSNFTGISQFQNPQTPTVSKPTPADLNYPVFTIDLSTLCPGIQYKFRVREKELSFNYWSNWSSVITFSVPGPAYSVGVSASDSLICPPNCSNLTATSQNACGADTFTWVPNLGTGANQTVCPTSQTTYVVTGSTNVPFCPIPITDTAAVTVGIEPPAVSGNASISPSEICSGDSITLSLTGYTGNIQWESSTSPNGPFIPVSGANSDLYTTGSLTLETYFRANISTCTNEYSNIVSVEVINLPTANFSTSNVCFNEIMNFNDLSTDNISIDSWFWDFGNGNTSNQQNPSNNYSSPGEYSVSLQVENQNGCFDEIIQLVSVYPIPSASFNFNEVCEDLPTELNSTSTVDAPSIISNYEWDINANGVVDYTSQNPSHNFNTYGNYTVSLIATSDAGCSDTIQNNIDVYALPLVDFDFTPLCFGLPTDYNDQTSIPDGGNISSWQWDFGDGNGDSIQNPSYSYASSGQYTVELTVETENGCSNNNIQPIDIYPLPSASFEVDNECFYNPFYFQNNSSANAINFDWDFGDSSLSDLENPNHQYNSAGTYDVTLIVNSSEFCSDTIVQNVVAYAQPQSNFDVSPTCLGSNSIFDNNSSITNVDGDEITNYFWDYGDGNTSNEISPIHTYDEEGIYEVDLTVISNYGCENTFTNSSTVWPLPNVSFSIFDNCLGIDGEFNSETSISNEYTTNDLTDWLWDFSDGSYSENENTNHAFDSSGVFEVTLTVISSNGCINSFSDSLTILEFPIADFVTTTSSGYIPLDVNFINNSSLGNQYEWDFGNGDLFSSVNPENTNSLYIDSGVYVVTLTATNDYCYDEDTTSIIVKGFPEIKYNLPNIFSPNNDNVNDYLHFELENAVFVNVRIFNRWGNLVGIINSSDNKKGWDGNDYKTNKPVSEGVYFYKYELHGIDGNIVSGNGYVHLVRN